MYISLVIVSQLRMYIVWCNWLTAACRKLEEDLAKAQNDKSVLERKLRETDDRRQESEDKIALQKQEIDGLAQEKRDIEVCTCIPCTFTRCTWNCTCSSISHLNHIPCRHTTTLWLGHSQLPNRRLASTWQTRSSWTHRSLTCKAKWRRSWPRERVPYSSPRTSLPPFRIWSRKSKDSRPRRTSWKRTGSLLKLPYRIFNLSMKRWPMIRTFTWCIIYMHNGPVYHFM